MFGHPCSHRIASIRFLLQDHVSQESTPCYRIAWRFG